MGILHAARASTLALLTLAASLTVAAAAPETDPLPRSPDYRGEIRRGPDGKLMAVPPPSPEPKAEEPPQPRSSPSPTAGQKILRVGPGTAIATVGEAARLARDGDIIEIRAGTYSRQPVVWKQKRLTIRGVGERPVMMADGASADDKAIWVIADGEFDIENIEFRGARVADGNGAGIRFEHGTLRIRKCAFFDNEMGILTANFADATLEIADSEFGAAPRHRGDLHHLLYVGAIGKFTLVGSRFSGGYRGHLVKSRARENLVAYNLLADGPQGQASYELEFPNGGVAYVIGNLIGQNAATQNPTLVSYGAEGPRWPDNALYLVHNTLTSEFNHGNFLFVWSDKFRPDTEVWVINNLTVGYGNLAPAPNGRFEGNQNLSRAELIPVEGIPIKLPLNSPLRGSVRPPGSARSVDLLPRAEFAFPVGSRPLVPPSRLAPGAFQ